MSKYEIVSVSESQLEDLVRRYCEKIEAGMRYITHQKPAAGGRLDVLLADSGNGLVVAELKIVEEDDMLMQAVDYSWLWRNDREWLRHTLAKRRIRT